MKYIRTKDGVYEYPEEKFIKDNKVARFVPGHCFIEWDDILGEADTIEELCDEFVWIKHLDNETYRKFYEKIDTKNKVLIGDDSKLHYQPREELEIYGAIETNKGLIYVAKMNKEGELELL